MSKTARLFAQFATLILLRKKALRFGHQLTWRWAKAAMLTSIDRYRKQVVESKRCYEKKRAQGKSHNQAIRALGRPL